MTLKAVAPPMSHPFSLPFALDGDGVARVAGTRVTLTALLNGYVRGDSAHELHEGFPSVPLSEIHAVICYFLRNQPAVGRWLEGHNSTEDVMLKNLEVPFPQPSRQELRRRLAEAHASTR